ncbi:hypothetical protein [Alicyclobacillus suci]|nr:hypothetical protein [Alicyclobacillus suci]
MRITKDMDELTLLLNREDAILEFQVERIIEFPPLDVTDMESGTPR